MQVKALNRFPFGMRYLDKDEVVEMPDVQARVFIKVGLVEEYKEPKPKRQYRRRDMTAGASRVAVPEQTAVMAAEDETDTE